MWLAAGSGCRGSGGPSTLSPRRSRTACRSPGRRLSVRPRVGRIERGAAVTDVRAVQLGGHVDGQPARRMAASVTSVSGVADDEVAAHREEHLGLAVAHGADGVARRRGRGRGAGEAELGVQGVEERSSGSSPRCPWCGRPGRWSGRGPGRRRRRAADVAAQQQQVDDFSGWWPRPCLCWVRPIAQQTMVRRAEAMASPALLDRGPFECQWRRRRRPSRVGRGRARRTARSPRCGGDEVVVDDGAGRGVLGVERAVWPSAWNRAMVAAEADLQEVVGDRGAATDQAAEASAGS